jgi:outer membrane protein
MKGIAAMVLAVLLGVSASAWAQTGFVNVQKLILESKEGKKATQLIQEDRQKKEKEVLQKKAELDALKESIAKASAEKKDITVLVKDYAEKEKELKRQVEDADLELKMRDKELTDALLKKAGPALGKIAKDKKLDLVITNPAVVGYVAPEADITDAVVKELDKSSK